MASKTQFKIRQTKIVPQLSAFGFCEHPGLSTQILALIQ